MEENTSINLSKQESFTSVKKPKRDDSKDQALCRYYFTFYVVSIHIIPSYLFRNLLLGWPVSSVGLSVVQRKETFYHM